MNLMVKKIFFFIMLVSEITSFGFSQIIAPDADKTVFTDTIAGRVDPIYVFCSSAFADDDTLAGLVAQTPGSITALIEWSLFNDTAYVYDAPFLVESGVTSSAATDLSSGGYRVKMTDGGSLDTVFYVWEIGRASCRERV